VDSDLDTLRALLWKKIQDASHEAISGNGGPSKETLDELDRLARLVEARERARPARRSSRWSLAIVAGLTLLLVSLLLFLRVPETEVELVVTASGVGFVLSQPQPLTDIMNLDALSVSATRSLRVPEPLRSGTTNQAPSADGAPMRVSAKSQGGRAGTVTLAPLALPVGVEVHVASSPTGSDGRISLRGASAPVRITVHGPVAVDLATGATGAVDFDVPQSIAFETDAGEVTLVLASAANPSFAFAPQLSVEKLSFSQIDEFHTPAGTTTQAISTVLSGTLYFESLNGAARQLRPRELLRFDDIRGVVRTLRIEGEQVTMTFRGTVRGLRSGWSDRPASLMPTYLDWFQAQHGLSLLWGTTIYLIGVVAAVQRWWRVDV
jgi:hypothetical protein